jgi:hypothetical protein
LWLTPSYRHIDTEEAGKARAFHAFSAIFIISNRLPRLLTALRTSVVLTDFCERRNGARRRFELIRPRPSLSIEPHCLHAGARRADHIRQRIIADVQNFGGLDACDTQ